jgi:cysteine desulfurase
MTDSAIYLDYNATTPLLREVFDAMIPYLRDHFGNPSSTHERGSVARTAVERAREQVAALLGCDADEVLFTSGGTEANNLAIRGATAGSERRHVATSRIEHPAVAAPCAWLEAEGWRVTRCGVDHDGKVLLSEMSDAIDERTSLVTVMHANNETGVLQPVRAVADAARAAGALVHSDAAQSVGKVPARVRELGVDLLSVAGHKLYAPKGVGALYVRRGTPLVPLLLGAGHERGMRPGTENVASVVGLGVACERARIDMEAEGARVAKLRDSLWQRLRALVPGLELNGHPTDRLPNTLSVRFPGVSGNALLAACPEVAASTGSACHAGGEQAPSAVVLMGVSRQDALGTVRLTIGRRTTADEIRRAAELLAGACQAIPRVGDGWHPERGSDLPVGLDK